MNTAYINLFVRLIIRGQKTIDDIPESYRQEVLAAMDLIEADPQDE